MKRRCRMVGYRRLAMARTVDPCGRGGSAAWRGVGLTLLRDIVADVEGDRSNSCRVNGRL